MKRIGVLCSGRSLGQLSRIADNFKVCYIVNLWEKEAAIVGEYVRGKTITYMLNADQRPYDKRRLCGVVDNSRAFVAWTKSMMTDSKVIKTNAKVSSQELMRRYKTVFKKVSYIPEEYKEVILWMRNLGVFTVRFVSQEVRPDVMWIAGLDFYACGYLAKKRLSDHHKSKIANGWIERLAGYFLDTVKRFPDTRYKILTEYTGLPNLPNLEVL
jgi:hypothetical protein